MVEETKENNVYLTQLEDKLIELKQQMQKLQDTVREHNEVLRKFKMLKG